MNDEARKSVTIKMKPGTMRKARIGVASTDKRLGEWLEEAIEEKVAREGGRSAKD